MNPEFLRYRVCYIHKTVIELPGKGKVVVKTVGIETTHLSLLEKWELKARYNYSVKMSDFPKQKCVRKFKYTSNSHDLGLLKLILTLNQWCCKRSVMALVFLPGWGGRMWWGVRGKVSASKDTKENVFLPLKKQKTTNPWAQVIKHKTQR